MRLLPSPRGPSLPLLHMEASLTLLLCSHILSIAALQDDKEGQDRYRVAVVRLVSFAVDKLNDKGTWHTIVGEEHC